jgi:hypothetical protein
MVIHSNLVCAGHTPESPCKVIDEKPVPAGFSVAFDTLEETWGDMLAFVRANGWKVEGGPDQRSVKCYCPDHSKE